jgi:hypothetical protein
MQKRYRCGARFVMDVRQYCHPRDRNERARILFLSEALERRTRPPGARNGVVSQPGLRVLRALLLHFLRGSDGLCTPSYVVLMAATGLCKQSISNALKRLEAAGIVRITRRLVREVVDAGGFLVTVTRQASNLYSIFEPGEHADRLPLRQPAPRPFPKGAYAALANLLGWQKPRRGLPREQLQHGLMRGGVLPDGFQYPGNASIAL